MGAIGRSLPAFAGVADSAIDDGRPAAPAKALYAAVRRRCAAGLVTANTIGAAVVFILGLYVMPSPHLRNDAQAHRLNLIAFGVCLAGGLVCGWVWSYAASRRASRWLIEDRRPTQADVSATIGYPLTQARIEAVLWAAAAALFVAINAAFSATVALMSGIEIVLGALVTCALTYMITEKLSRPLTAYALQFGAPPEAKWMGVRCRLALAWVFGAVVPIVALVLVGVALIAGVPASNVRYGAAVIIMGAVGILAGLATIAITAHSLADPLSSLREAVGRVERGELDVSVRVDDASEVGMLQTGFNRMVDGLRERDRLRDLFGRHVGEQVAAEALERGEVELGGETRDAAVLFVDLIGSTALATRWEPQAVVAELNAFFAIVVDCVSLHGGWVNKFEGDAALCVFGAPTTHPDPAGAALMTARELRRRLERQLPDLDAAIGVSAGTVVAGNVGSAERYEYTVIGDPVNEASRLTDLAKSSPGRLLASDAALERAGEPERERWIAEETVTLRGRAASTVVASPR